LTIHDDRLAERRAQRDMQDRSIFGDVDPLSAKHCFDVPAKIAFFGKMDQKTDRFIRDAILRIVQVKACGPNGEPFAALRIIAEELPQMDIPYRSKVFR
jgi:hypothetical protein